MYDMHSLPVLVCLFFLLLFNFMIYFIENYKSTEGSKNLIQMVIFVKKKKMNIMNMGYNYFLTLTNISRFIIYQSIEDQFSHSVSSVIYIITNFLKKKIKYVCSNYPGSCKVLLNIPFS